MMRNQIPEMKSVLTRICLLITILLASSLTAQSGLSNARSMAMAGAYTALARGVEAPRWNPANLGLSGKDAFNFNLISVGLGLYNNSFSKHQYDLYNGSYLTTEDKMAILSSIPDDGFKIDFDTEIQALGFSFGNFAFTLAGEASSDFAFSRDAIDLLLNGNDLDRAYDIRATAGEGWGLTSFGFSAGFPVALPLFKEFSVGGTFKYLKSFGYAKVKESENRFTTEIDGLNGSGRIVVDYAQGGSGLALDIGAAAVLNKGWFLSLGIKNILNYINWNSEPKSFIYTFTLDSLTAEKVQQSDIDSVFVDSKQTVEIDPFTTSLSPELRLGIAHSSNRFAFAVDLTQGIRRVAGVSTNPRAAIGTELRLLHFFPVRAGLSIGGKHGFSSSAGFGLDFSVFSWDFAVSSRGGLFSGRGIGAAFGWMFRL